MIIENFRIRSAKKSDIEELYYLSKKVYFINLPSDRKIIRKKIALSIKSFSNEVIKGEKTEFIFVLEDLKKNKIAGCCSIIAQHGTADEPHTFFKVAQKTQKSKSLNIQKTHEVLRIGFNYNGPTEIGGLVLLPQYRGHQYKLGLFLSFVRFAYIAARKPFFQKQIMAELMPPLDNKNKSLLWEELGARFTGLSYQQADVLSRKNKEFIINLFPEGDIYTAFLSHQAKALIGEVGKNTQPVKKMLSSIGFEYSNMIDPFDGGPHYWAQTDDVLPIKNTLLLSKKVNKKILRFKKSKWAIVLSVDLKNGSCNARWMKSPQFSKSLRRYYFKNPDTMIKAGQESYFLPIG